MKSNKFLRKSNLINNPKIWKNYKKIKTISHQEEVKEYESKKNNVLIRKNLIKRGLDGP